MSQFHDTLIRFKIFPRLNCFSMRIWEDDFTKKRRNVMNKKGATASTIYRHGKVRLFELFLWICMDVTKFLLWQLFLHFHIRVAAVVILQDWIPLLTQCGWTGVCTASPQPYSTKAWHLTHCNNCTQWYDFLIDYILLFDWTYDFKELSFTCVYTVQAGGQNY